MNHDSRTTNNEPFNQSPTQLFYCSNAQLSAFAPLHLSRVLYKSTLFLQNKPNFRKSQMNVNTVVRKDYEKTGLSDKGKTNPIQTQYKPNTNPIQTQYKPNTKPIQTQSNPIFVPLVLFIGYNYLQVLRI